MAEMPDLTRLIEPEARALGFDLVRVRLFGANSKGGGDERTLQVMAERPDTRQLTIDDCADLSRRLSDMLDREDPIADAYRLEVSSPGIDRPLTRAKDFADWAGHEVRIVLTEPQDGQKQFKGELTGIDGDLIGVSQKNGADARVPFKLVADAKLVLTDKLIAATVPLSMEGADEEELEEEETD